NVNASEANYYGQNPKFIRGAVSRFWVYETLEFFRELGIWHKEEENGKVYPYSDQASAVLDVLRMRIEELGVTVKTKSEVRSVSKNKNGFSLMLYSGEKFSFDAVIVASGGKAAPDLGSNGSGYDILKSFGHRITELRPSLVQIKTETDVVKNQTGIKIQGSVKLGKTIERGEILFTEYGLSGPPIFSISSRLNGQEFIDLDIIPEYSAKQLTEMLTERVYSAPKITLENFFVGVLNKRVGQALLKYLKIEPLSRSAETLTARDIEMTAKTMKAWRFKITGTMSWNNAQVTKGGAITSEFNPNTMESKLVSGLYAVGEVLDIDGDCGGYNLQWAWSSGMLAGRSVR
ncbi:MAG: NAD(P)/FAD-dependent oxidoreductase, partial [Oscillospiraceae bacterium]|nr:NAD(P)/FAD-dependent oxidoreductase [Oscillospiraceae bacterium]